MIPSSVRIFVCTEPQDMRKGFDGLALSVREKLGEDPRSGALFVFTNRRANRLKVLWWDHSGYCVMYKRLHRALFRLPSASATSSGPAVRIEPERLAALLRGVARPRRCHGRKRS